MPDTLFCNVKSPNMIFGISDDASCSGSGISYLYDYGRSVKTFTASPEDVFGINSRCPYTASINDNISVTDYRTPIKEGAAVVILILMFCGLMLLMKSYFSELLKVLKSFKSSHKEFEEETKSKMRFRKYITVFYTVIITGFAFTGIEYFYPDLRFKYEYLLMMLLLFSGTESLKSGFIDIAGYLTLNKDVTDELKFNKNSVLGFTGVLLFPVLIITLLYNKNPAMVQIMFYAGGFLLSGGLIYLIIRYFMVFTASRISVFYVFLYICIFEISPYLLLYIVAKEHNRFLTISNLTV